MNDCPTLCRSCNRASNGYEYCRVCESSIIAKELADDERGFCLPVRVGYLLIGGKCVVSSDGKTLVAINLEGENRATELAEVLRDAINAHYGECDGDGA